jgi:hypothetical protein
LREHDRTSMSALMADGAARVVIETETRSVCHHNGSGHALCWQIPVPDGPPRQIRDATEDNSTEGDCHG